VRHLATRTDFGRNVNRQGPELALRLTLPKYHQFCQRMGTIKILDKSTTVGATAREIMTGHAKSDLGG
jgi:hypothetical protein